MLSPQITLALPQVITGIEEKAEHLGWDAPPVLLALFHRHLVTGSPLHLIEVEPSPFALDLQPGSNSGLTGVLNLLAGFICIPENAPELNDWLDATHRTFVGYALVFEGFQYTPYADYTYGDINTVPAMADAEVRLVVAIDTNGRRYETRRIRGEGPQPITVHDALTPNRLAGAIPDVLSRLVTATHHL
ncbi:hypothetical protein [Verrucosispora sp. WMMD573]|uniref:hypothetical protein n=1 Tax=Verrucosispora sp. WMMD573 TaxID=3015149 RepID=UPI00248C7112|nr:hypothetical protein [Verrucosispora sp. WMMD573]WBB52403.1 hypothetical protein O7601_17595 [Verrucosispora sp. WMMD573]